MMVIVETNTSKKTYIYNTKPEFSFILYYTQTIITQYKKWYLNGKKYMTNNPKSNKTHTKEHWPRQYFVDIFLFGATHEKLRPRSPRPRIFHLKTPSLSRPTARIMYSSLILTRPEDSRRPRPRSLSVFLEDGREVLRLIAPNARVDAGDVSPSIFNMLMNKRDVFECRKRMRVMFEKKCVCVCVFVWRMGRNLLSLVPRVKADCALTTLHCFESTLRSELTKDSATAII